MNRISLRMNWKKTGAMLLAGLLFTMVLVTGCGGSQSKSDSASYEMTDEGGFVSGQAGSAKFSEMAQVTGEEADFNGEGSEGAYGSDGTEGTGGADGKSQPSDNGGQTRQKLIYTYYYYFDTTEYDKSVGLIENAVKKYRGYVESSSSYGTENRSASMVVRIPADKADAFLEEAGSFGKVTSKEVSSENITLRYYDMKAHLESLNAQRTRLLELLESAKKISDIIEIQSQLTSVEYEINSSASQLKVYDNQVDYVTFNISLNEVTTIEAARSEGFFARVKKGLADNTADVINGLTEFSIWFITMLPYLILLLIILLAVRLVFKALKKKGVALPEKKRRLMDGRKKKE